MPLYRPLAEHRASLARFTLSLVRCTPKALGLGIGLALGAASASTGAQKANGGPPLARIDGEPVTVETFERQHPDFSSWFGHGVVTLDDALGRLNQTIVGELLAREARATGLADNPEVQRAIDGLLAQAYLMKRLPPSALQVPEEAVRAAYDADRDAYRAPQRLRISQILVASEEQAAAVRAELDAGRSFEELAALHSLDPSFPDSKSDMGWARADRLPDAFAAATRTLEIGQPSEVVRTRFGYHVAVVTARAPREYIPYQDVRGKIHKALREGKRAEQMAALRRELFERYRVQIDREALAARIARRARPEVAVEVGEEKDASTPPPHPELAVLSGYHEIDPEGSPAAVYGLVRNVGASELVVSRVKPTCPCMSATVEPSRLPPGEFGRLIVRMVDQKTAAPKHGRHAVVIETNNPRKPTEIVRVAVVAAPEVTKAEAVERFFSTEPIKLGEGKQWKFNPLVVDIDGDGRKEIVATHRQPVRENALHIWAQKANGSFESLPQRWENPGYSELTAADVDRDGQVDLIAASHYSAVMTMLGDGNGAFGMSRVEGPVSFVSAALGDFDGDSLLDLVTLAESQKGGLQVYRGDGAGGWVPGPRLDEGRFSGRQVKVADLNGDGHLDILAVGGNNLTGIYHGDGAGRWTRADVRFHSSTQTFNSAAIADVDGDGNLDIALNGGADGTADREGPSVFLGDGGGRYRPASQGLKRFRFTARGVAIEDVDGDGHMDLIATASLADVKDFDPLPEDGKKDGEFGNDEYGLFLFSGDGRGEWRLRTDSGLPASGLATPNGLAVDDLNGDGRVDIVVSHGKPMSEGGYISIWLHK